MYGTVPTTLHACRLEEQGSKLQQQEQAVEQQINVVLTDIHKGDNRLKQLRSSMKTMQASKRLMACCAVWQVVLVECCVELIVEMVQMASPVDLLINGS
jgi:hypothetical protein